MNFFNEVTALEYLIRGAGFVYSDRCGSRGHCFISAYKPSKYLQKRGVTGFVEVRFDGKLKTKEIIYNLTYDNETRQGQRDIAPGELAAILTF